MGLMRFRVFPTERITEEVIQQVYLSGIDRALWPVRVRREGEHLVLHRSASDSAVLHIPWRVEGFGSLILSTGMLMERDEPYSIPLEIARGAVLRVRDQYYEWQSFGLAAPPEIDAKLGEAMKRFAQAAVGQNDPAASAEQAEIALRLALEVGESLSAAYVEQVLTKRLRAEGRLTGFLGANLGTQLLDNQTARKFLHAFNAAAVPLRWRDLETTEGRFSWSDSDKQVKWCLAHGLKVLGGPLVSLDYSALPDWLCLFEDDYDALLHSIAAFVRAVVERYRGSVDYWICASRLNASEVLGLSEPDRLRLAGRIVELVRTLDPNTPALVSFDQPWAEYMRRRESDFPPMHFADALIRAGSDLGGLALEINAGYSPDGTLLRHSLDFHRMLESWSLFGLPLWLSLCVPSDEGEDPLAVGASRPTSAGWSSATQQTWTARYVSLALAKPAVRGILWNQLRDGEPHDFPHGGLFNARRHSKPALRVLSHIRQSFLE